MSLTILPDDVLHAILPDLDHRSILACQATCRRFKTLVDSSMDLQYVIEPAAAGMCEGPAVQYLALPERLQRLRAYEDARTGPIALQELPFVPALAGDLWRMRISVTTIVTVAMEAGVRERLYVQQMPSAVRGIEERHWEISLPPYHAMAAVDASQDLLVVNGYPSELRILSLSTGERHPLASGPDIFLDAGIDNTQVFGEYCAATSSGYLIIWNWRPVPPEPTFAYRPSSQWTLLNDTHIAIMSKEPEAILVYAFRTGGGKDRVLPPPTVFELPNCAPESPSRMTICSDVAGTQHEGLFHPTPSSRMLSITISVRLCKDQLGGYKHQRLELAIPADTLLAHVPSAEAVPWARWGPAGSVLSP
ncbi:hypothetical protein FA95DRAFT_1571720 [Auriscalpium vulgare]|uniref:Uncharacterized protein n=1 Tax=Auriscalpium vulgare TaxID=40419 RepID=A0ACB8RXG5_9AGAM|nr:hypothetical protein FA95DRAFT_1571720 [Auriscalpium vulgare]